MSHYVDIECAIKDRAALVRALERVGFKGKIEIHDKAQNLYGYQGDLRNVKANVILRRRYVGSVSNDIGFEKLSSGFFVAHISEFDHNKYGKKWQDELYTYSLVETAKIEYEKKGWNYTEEIDDKNRIKLRVKV